MYADENLEDTQNYDRERRERRKNKHRKSREVNDDDVYNGGVTAEVNIQSKLPDLSLRRSEEENFEPVTEPKRKHRHRRSRVEEPDYPDDESGGARVREDEDPISVEEQEEARRQRREKKRRARERKKLQEESYQETLSPQSEVNNYPFEAETEPQYQEDEPQYDEQPEVSYQEDDQEHETPPIEEPKPKKKSGGFGKIFASFKKKNKTPKADATINAQWESNPDIFNPGYDSQPGTLEKSKKKVTGKSGSGNATRKVHIILLDGEEVELDIDHKSSGANLFDKVCAELDLIEKDFFGMTYVNSKVMTWFWLDMEKKISKQLGKDDDWTFNFQVKFYPPEPVLLQEDITRYLLSLQVRQDVYTGKLPCSWITQALLGSFMVQSELGDYDELENGDSIDYLREFEFVLNQSEQLLEKICELHKKHVGMSPDKADIKYLETAKRLEQYGVDLHPARDNDDVEIFIGVSYQGILIYRERLRIGRFAWPKVLRISYKKNYFYLKIRSDRYDDSVAIVGFKLLNHNLAKRLWKNAAEQHTFFRMKESQMVKNSGRKIVPTAGSNFTYTGKTLHQYRTMNITRTAPAHFDRSVNKRRTIGSMPAGLNSAGMQYSSMHSLNRAHPRDMTLGKTKSVEHLSSRKPMSMSNLHQDREGSIGSFNNSRNGSQQQQQPMYPPYGSISSYKDSDRRQSLHSGDSLNGGNSYMVNHDDQLSLPPMSPNIPNAYDKPVKKHRSKPSSSEVLSDDGIISPPPREPIRKPVKTTPLPLPPDTHTSDSEAADSLPRPKFKKQHSKPTTNQSNGRPVPQFKPPPPPPEPIQDPPSISSSIRSSQMGSMPPPPPPPPMEDLPSIPISDTIVYPKNTLVNERARPPVIKPKPATKPKPNFAAKERTVATKPASRRHNDDSSNDDML